MATDDPDDPANGKSRFGPIRAMLPFVGADPGSGFACHL
jgi:hypothetical protein